MKIGNDYNGIDLFYIPLMNKLFIILLSFSICYLHADAQNSVQLPRVIPANPDAAALGKYGFYPVNLSNGLVNIDIPLYTVRSRKLELPISLSYHPSGIKVDEVASWVGLGWVLQAGGVLTRTVRGKPDEYGGSIGSSSFMTTAEVYQQTDGGKVQGYLMDKATDANDTESDVYAYSVNGLAGKFRYSIDNEIIQIPLTDNKIIASPGISYQITSDNGTTYLFDVTEMTSNNNSGQVPTAFYLSKMISADKTDTIYFDYFADNTFYSEVYESSSISLADQGFEFTNPVISTVNTSSTKILQKIRFSDGYVDFVQAGDRKDRRKYRLSQINIYSNDKILKQSIKLNHDYFISSYAPTPTTTYSENVGHRLKLNGVELIDKQGKIIGTYTFNYESFYKLPSYWAGSSSKLGGYYAQDKFGYYNGRASNEHFQSVKHPAWTSFQVADRNVYPEYAQAGMLKEINYPTGGKTAFTYESNATYGTTVLVGGLRIRKIETYGSGQSRPEVKEYTYGPGFSANNMFYLDRMANYTYTVQEDSRTGSGLTTREVYTCNPLLPLTFNSDNGVFYREAAEILSAASGRKLGKTEYKFEYEDDGYYSTNVVVPWYINFKRFEMYFVDMGWARGPVREISVYGVTPDGAFTSMPVKQTINVYQKYGERNYIAGISVFLHNTWINGVWTGDAKTEREHFQFFDILVATGGKKLKQTIENEFSLSGTLSKTTTYYYDGIGRTTNPHWLVTKKYETGSDGDAIQTSYQYPADFEGAAVYDGMLLANIKSPVIKQVQKINGVDNKGTYTHYNTYSGAGGTMYLPSSVQEYKKGKGFEDALIFDAYNDRGSIVQMHKADDIKTSYLWSYNKMYPIARVVNAADNQVAYTSFEADGTGNWTVGSTTRVTTDAITGQQSYNLGSGNMSRSGLDPAKTYLLSYWTRSGATITATGAQTTTQGHTLNGWTYWEKKISGVSSITISGSGTIDEVRFYPADAQMTTFTYQPLTGATSQCDANNHIVYYEYDGYNRLKLVRDEDKSIIKTLDYNYTSGN